LPELGRREAWTRDEIESYQLDRLNRVWAHALGYVPYYRDLAAGLRLPRWFTSLEEFRERVPVLSKTTVRARGAAFLSERADRGVWRLTGGSTGVSTRVFWSKAAHREVLWAKYRFQQTWGVDFLDRSAFLWGHGSSFAPGPAGWFSRALVPVHDRLRRRLRLSAYELDRPHLLRHLERIAAFRPTYLYAYSTAAYLLALVARDIGFRSESLRLAILTAEPASPAVVAEVENAFQVPAVMEYGSIECGLLASEAPDRCLRIRDDQVYLETHPRDDGQYDIVVSVLTNPSFPLLRYALEDVSSGPLVRPAQGFGLLRAVAGRRNDLLYTRAGEPLHSFWFHDLFESMSGVRRWQVRQARDGSVRVDLEVPDPFQDLNCSQIEDHIRQRLDGYAARVVIVPAIDQTPAGKHRWIISELAADVAERRSVPREATSRDAGGEVA
jgi:phenylacetate-CoA ligase